MLFRSVVSTIFRPLHIDNVLCLFAQSPPPLCAYMKWIDLEQDSYHKKEVADEERRKWRYTFEMIREEEREKKIKIWQEKQRLNKEKKEQEEKEHREAEREKKKERARRAQEEAEEEEDARMRKGKFPRCNE